MGMIVQHNMNALNAYNKLNANVAGLKKSSEKLSSGYRINRAGDDAAGLAVSEKMRSQIRGLNQAVRNSQDGINMIQTFEGAAQETHSILQRMKELASESANGTYDNYTDRAAMQLEFEQLNDELNQIADTDFNGTVVLNGGEMSDGLKAVDGEFDYANKAGQVAEENAKILADAQAAAQKNIDAAQKKFDSAFATYDATENRDLCLSGDAVQWNTVDDNTYTAEAANDLFAAAANTDGDTLEDLGVSEFNVEFQYDEDDGWSVLKAWYIDGDGKEQELDASSFETLIGADGTIESTENGGFIVGGGVYGNAIFAGSEAKTGDVVSLKYTNSATSSTAPSNIGMDEESLRNDAGVAAPKLELSEDAQNPDKMSPEMLEALNKLDQATIEFQYSPDGLTATISDDSLTITDNTDGTFSISFKDSEGNDVTLATVTMQEAHESTTGNTASATAGGNFNAGAAGKTLEYKTVGDATGWYEKGTETAVDLTSVSVDGQTLNVTVSGTAVVGDEIVIKPTENSTNVEFEYVGQKATSGKVSFGVALDEGKFNATAVKPTIDPTTSPDGVDSRAIDKAYENAKKALEEAKAAYPKSIDDLPDNSGVTKADAFDNSTARMTYTENIVLQTGARTKDAVNFTFSYNRDGTADMGDLKANLNLSSREDGLNTANLSLATQEDANHAIDQIDKAINKTSMVRATFGAIQNRLEHKITNLTTTSENLQEAESSIRDTDMAQEMMNYTKYNILQQAAQSMLAQANQQPQSILQLLG